MNYLKRKYMALMRGVNFRGCLLKASGNPLILTNCVSNSPMQLSVFGNSTQDGTPTLDNPVEIQSVGDLVTDGTSEYYGKYDIPIVVRGKNLIKYPYATASRTMNGIRYTVNKDGSVSVVGTATAASYFILNGNVDFGNSSIPENSTNGVYATSEGVRYNVSNHTVSINVASGETVDKIVYPQIEYGTTATVYEPYIEETTHIYLDEPLRKFKDYADYIDFKKGTVVRNVVELNLLSKQVAELYTYNGRVGIRTNAVLRGNMRRMSGACNRVETGNIGESYGKNSMWLGVGTPFIYWIGILDILGISTLNEFKEWIDNNPTYIYYGFKSSAEEDIELPKILTQKGSNIITAATEIEPSNIQVKYIEK